MFSKSLLNSNTLSQPTRQVVCVTVKVTKKLIRMMMMLHQATEFLPPPSSTTLSSVSSSGFDTESTGSFFPDRSTSLGALMGVTTMFPTITFRTPPYRRDITPTITLGSTPNNRISVGQRRRKKDKVTNMVAERRRKRVRRWNWWRFCNDEDTKPSKLWELMEVERRFGVEALFSNELTDVNLGDHHRNDGRMLFANGRVLPPPNVTDVDEGTRCACSMFGLPVLLAAICSCSGGVR